MVAAKTAVTAPMAATIIIVVGESMNTTFMRATR